MGFRSTFITEDKYTTTYPEWFREKWKEHLMFSDNMVIAPKYEIKFYGTGYKIIEDIQKVLSEFGLAEKDGELSILLVYLHDCDGITKLKIYKDRVVYSEPTGWKEVDDVTHDECDRCSEISETKARGGDCQ